MSKHVEDFDSCNEAGDFFFLTDGLGNRLIHFRCPCGCGVLAGIRLCPEGQTNGWTWNGDEERPTARPSILINRGHWHGYLTDGEFKSC